MEADPSGQLAWLISELAAAEAAGERVYIIGMLASRLNSYFIIQGRKQALDISMFRDSLIISSGTPRFIPKLELTSE